MRLRAFFAAMAGWFDFPVGPRVTLGIHSFSARFGRLKFVAFAGEGMKMFNIGYNL